MSINHITSQQPNKLTDKEIQNILSGLGGTERETKIKQLAPYMTEDQYVKARMGAL